MAEQALGRRQLIRGAGAAAGGLAVTGLGGAMAAPAAAKDDDDHHDSAIAGSWLASVHGDDGSELMSVGSFAHGGVAITHDISPAGPPFTGSWEPRGENRFRATLWGGFPGPQGPGSVGPTARLRLRGRLRDDELSGTFRFVVFDPNGAVVERGSGTFEATRIEP